MLFELLGRGGSNDLLSRCLRSPFLATEIDDLLSTNSLPPYFDPRHQPQLLVLAKKSPCSLCLTSGGFLDFFGSSNITTEFSKLLDGCLFGILAADPRMLCGFLTVFLLSDTSELSLKSYLSKYSNELLSTSSIKRGWDFVNGLLISC
jgi:hypothetical protein